MDSTGLLGRVVVIMGGTTGLGLSAARACVQAGAHVVAVGHEQHAVPAAQQTLGAQAVVLTADAREPETATHAIAAGLEHFHGFHALYHVAGGSGRRHGDGPLHEVSDEGWRFTLDLNLTSLFYSARAAARQFMLQKSPGSVLLMSSVLGFAPSSAYFATHAYATAKAAIIGLTRSSASYYAGHNIRFNALAPAVVDTPMARRAMADPEIQQFLATKQPLDGGRAGRADDLDAAAVYFLSDASRFVTGQVLCIDGGWSVSEGQRASRPEKSS